MAGRIMQVADERREDRQHDSPEKSRVVGISLICKLPKPATSTSDVMIIAEPTARYVRIMAALHVAVEFHFALEAIDEMDRVVDGDAEADAEHDHARHLQRPTGDDQVRRGDAIGNKFGTMLISPSRKLRKPTVMTTKMIAAAEPRLGARSAIIWFRLRDAKHRRAGESEANAGMLRFELAEARARRSSNDAVCPSEPTSLQPQANDGATQIGPHVVSQCLLADPAEPAGSLGQSCSPSPGNAIESG